jgi:hypothetical protein
MKSRNLKAKVDELLNLHAGYLLSNSIKMDNHKQENIFNSIGLLLAMVLLPSDF